MATILDGLVSVAITATGATPQLPNTTTPAFACYLPTAVATVFAEALTREYVAASGWTDDGGAITDPAYYWLSAVFAQNPAPASAKIIRLTSAVTQAATFLVTDNTDGHQVGYQVVGTDGVTTDMYVTVSGQTTTQIATAIAALTDPAGVATTSSTATVTSTNGATKTTVYYKNIKGGTFLDTTPTATIATDLNNAIAQDNDWYGISIAYQDATNIAAVAAWAETNKKLFSYTTVDTANLTGGTGIGATLKTSGYTYSLGYYSGKAPNTYPGTGLAVQLFTATAGSKTLAYKNVAGATSDIVGTDGYSLSPTQVTALNTNNLNYEIGPLAGVYVTLQGKCASGMYADIRYGIDVLRGDMQIGIFALLTTSPKVPMDPKGIAQVGSQVRASLGRFSASEASPATLLRTDPGYEWWVTLPDVANISASDRGNRILRNVKWGAYAQGAVQTVFVTGNVSV